MIFVTTSHDPTEMQIEKAKKLADELRIPYLARKDHPNISETVEGEYCYVVEKSRIVIKSDNVEFFFHPSMAKVRMRNIQKGLKDHLIESLQLTGSETILDTTLGLGTEAILMAAFLDSGKVIGIEGSTPIFVVVRDGLENHMAKENWINTAMKKIQILHADFKQFLRSCPEESYDIVYCDPMFENPVFESSSMNPLRPFAIYDTVNTDDVDQMLRVAKKKIVLKAHAKDSLFRRIPVDRIFGSRRSQVLYGVIEKR
ncbi:MAG TPA: class I SAM-dependent methyltransferase [Pseudothermotoga sp.]